MMRRGDLAEVTIIFFTDTGLIRLEDKEIILSRQSKICLMYLCEHEGNIVSKEALHDACWKKHGAVVSDNTVRQTLFRIRKSLASLDVEEDILETLGYMGYRLKPDCITLISDSQNYTLPEPHSPAIEERESSELSVPLAPASDLKNKSSKIRLILITLGISCLFFNGGGRFPGQEFVHPLLFGQTIQINGHTFLFSHYVENGNAELAARVNYWLNKMQIAITPHSKIYINADHGNSINFFVCDGELELMTTTCQTFAVIGRNHP